MVLTGGFMFVEIVGGLISGSLALLADAGHMFTDLAALSLAWFAFRISQKPSDEKRSYGYHRFQVIAAFVNGITLVFLVGWIVIEAVVRLFKPVEVEGNVMLIVAALGLIVNVIAFVILHGGDRKNINMRGAAVHVLGDMLGSVATIVGGLVIKGTGWTPIDPLLSIFVAALVFRSAFDLVKKSAHILLEGSPEWLDTDRLRRDLKEAIPDITDVHHVHAWSLTPEKTMMTLHANITPGADNVSALIAIKKYLAGELGIKHSTVQVELSECSDEMEPEG